MPLSSEEPDQLTSVPLILIVPSLKMEPLFSTVTPEAIVRVARSMSQDSPGAIVWSVVMVVSVVKVIEAASAGLTGKKRNKAKLVIITTIATGIVIPNGLHNQLDG